MSLKAWIKYFVLFCVGVVILNTNGDEDYRNGALSPDNIQVMGTTSGTYYIIYCIIHLHHPA